MDKQTERKILRLITNTSFRNWCLGTAPEEENKYWQAWVEQTSARQQEAFTAKQIVLELEKQEPLVPKDKKYRNWKKLNRKIQIARHSSDPHTGGRNAIKSSFGWMVTAAASVILLIASFLTLQYTDFIQTSDPEEVKKPVPEMLMTTTDYGERKLITLDSGTKITLNANSSITYYDGWIYQDTVNVKLQGEAYFDVVSRTADEGPVFQVETADGNIDVLGTRFAVNTWEENTRVVLEEGRVAINSVRSDDRKDHKATLKPNQLAHFGSSLSEIMIESVNTKVFTSWKEGLFVFERAPLTAVARRIEKIFGKKVIIADFGLTTERVSGAVENDDLEVLLSALSQTLQITVIEQDDQIIFKNAAFESSFYKQTNK